MFLIFTKSHNAMRAHGLGYQIDNKSRIKSKQNFVARFYKHWFFGVGYEVVYRDCVRHYVFPHKNQAKFAILIFCTPNSACAYYYGIDSK